MSTASSTVLYVEDEENDRVLMGIAFVKEGLGAALQTVNNGKAAQDYLAGTQNYGDREKHPIPAAVLLDLNLPEVHGFDVLKWIRTHPMLNRLPVVVFTSSDREEDRARAQLLGANDFVQKPSSPKMLRDVVRKVSQSWLSGNPVQ